MNGKSRIVLTGVFATLLAGVVVLILAALLPPVLGMQSYVVYSGSMEPSIRTGDAVVVRPLDPQELEVDDVITYRASNKPNEFITHRIVEIKTTDGDLVFQTKGDANTTLDLDEVGAARVVGKLLYPVPFAGYLLHFSNTPLGKMLLVGVPAVLLIVGALPGAPFGKKRAAKQSPSTEPS